MQIKQLQTGDNNIYLKQRILTPELIALSGSLIVEMCFYR